jgi:hypothetical protein
VTGATFATAAWPSSNRAIYIALALPFAYPVKRAWWVNGGTVTGQADVGIFDAQSGVKLFSTGATAQSGTNASQYVTVDWLVQPGSYYLGMSLSNTAGIFSAAPGGQTSYMRLSGCLQEASAHPLPSTMTPAAITSIYWPLFGLTRTTSGY